MEEARDRPPPRGVSSPGSWDRAEENFNKTSKDYWTRFLIILKLRGELLIWEGYLRIISNNCQHRWISKIVKTGTLIILSYKSNLLIKNENINVFIWIDFFSYKCFLITAFWTLQMNLKILHHWLHRFCSLFLDLRHWLCWDSPPGVEYPPAVPRLVPPLRTLGH